MVEKMDNEVAEKQETQYQIAALGLILGAGVGFAIGGAVTAAMGAGVGLVLGAAIDSYRRRAG